MLEFKNSDQVKSYMKKEARNLKISISSAYQTFTARTLLERISKYNDDEILIKGSSAEIAYLGSLVRAMTDIDIATTYTYHESIAVVMDAINDHENDCFCFSLANSMKRTPTGIYKLKVSADYGTIHQPISMDLQENYGRLIEPERRVMPAIFEGDKPFEIYVPSFEEYLAEKMCIVLESNKPDVLNTRVKDLYDIYQLHGGKYDNDKLTEYFKKIMELRGKIKLEEARTNDLNSDFVKRHQEVWDSTREKYDFADKEIDLEGALYYTRAVLREQLQKNGQEMSDIFAYQKRLESK